MTSLLQYPWGVKLLPEPVEFETHIPLSGVSYTPKFALVRYWSKLHPTGVIVAPYIVQFTAIVIDSEADFHTREFRVSDFADFGPSMPNLYQPEALVLHKLKTGTSGQVAFSWGTLQSGVIDEEHCELLGFGSVELTG